MPGDVARALTGVRPGGCIQTYLQSFAEHLIGQGYATLTARNYVETAARIGRWMGNRGIPLTALSDDMLASFARHHRRRSGSGRSGRHPSARYMRRARLVVEYLRSQGVVPTAPATEHATHPLVASFRQWMVQHRGLSTWTINRYEYLVAKVLPALGEDPSVYDAARVRDAIVAHVQGFGRAYAKCHVAALRAFLRYLAVEGHCRPCLEQAVPTIPSWPLSSLPRYLESADVERVIESCDRGKPCGVRDRAVLLLLARLGLRAGDILGMTLQDLDWGSGTVRVRAKSRREVSLPLPQDVGDAILEYLVHARPRTELSHVFFCSNAPTRPFPTTVVVSDIVRLALQRAGIADPPSRGAHLLRHSAATAMLRRGASLDAIAAILRHQSTDTTAHYAKVDVKLLAGVTQPWPELRSC